MIVKEAIVLAGGLGTRLKEVTGLVPKVMAYRCRTSFHGISA